MDNELTGQKIEKRRLNERDLFLKQKYDLEEVFSIICQMENKFNFRAMSSGEEYSQVAIILHQIRASFIAPAYAYNRFVDSVIQDLFWDDVKYQVDPKEFVSMGLRESQMIADLHNCLVTIKMALDRTLKLFIVYYRGFSPNTTFGHINQETDKAKGFMGYVQSNKEGDEILMYVYEEYIRWIRFSVQPRDAIVHYDDVAIEYQYISELCCETPIFHCCKGEENITIDFPMIASCVRNFYEFYKGLLDRLYLKNN